jgi:hypothetical protein
MNRIELQQDGASELHGERQATLPAADQETSRAPVPGPPSRRMRIAAIVIPLLVIGGLLLGFFPRLRERRTAVADMTQLAIPTVSVVSLTPLRSGDGLILPAEIRPWREASIYARANGYLKDWKTDIGAHVQANQLLAEIETPDLDQQLDQAKAQVVLAQAKLHLAETTDVRWQMLLKTVSVSQQEADEKSAARETESAAVEAERANMRRLQQLVFFERVIAPFDGTVTRREVDNDVLPPHLGNHATDRASMSPYLCNSMELCTKLGTTDERRQILLGFFELRDALRQLGMISGFQWLEGSFTQNVEKPPGRAPNDIDVVTFYPPITLPTNLTPPIATLLPVLGNRDATKQRFRVDHILVPLASTPDRLADARRLVDDVRYWFGLFSHRRSDDVWKGMLQLPLDTAAEDVQAADSIRARTP